mmetsp:Transcript_13554/g.44639  ORF Transcript_13554/g.44639 Transcript_13554/m.44639 type:complete len:220 (+) Transcript_13554:124-783(+)
MSSLAISWESILMSNSIRATAGFVCLHSRSTATIPMSSTASKSRERGTRISSVNSFALPAKAMARTTKGSEESSSRNPGNMYWSDECRRISLRPYPLWPYPFKSKTSAMPRGEDFHNATPTPSSTTIPRAHVSLESALDGITGRLSPRSKTASMRCCSKGDISMVCRTAGWSRSERSMTTTSGSGALVRTYTRSRSSSISIESGASSRTWCSSLRTPPR